MGNLPRTPNLRRIAGLFLVSMALMSTYLPAATPEGYTFRSYGDALARANEQGKPVFLYFGRYGCSVCLRMHQEVFSDALVKRRFNDNYVLAYVDTESGERVTLPNRERITEMQLASRVRILGTPTFFFLASDQTPLIKLNGFQSIEEMLGYDDFISGGHYRSQTFKEYLSSR